MQFDSRRQQFYLTVDDVIQNTQFTSEDLVQNNIDLNEISQGTYRVMHSFYKGANPQKHADILKDMIVDDPDKQQALLNAMLEFLRGALVSGMDLNAYIASVVYDQNTGMNQQLKKTNSPYTVRQELRIGGLYYPGELL